MTYRHFGKQGCFKSLQMIFASKKPCLFDKAFLMQIYFYPVKAIKFLILSHTPRYHPHSDPLLGWAYPLRNAGRNEEETVPL